MKRRGLFLLILLFVCMGLMSSCSAEDHAEIRSYTDRMVEALVQGNEAAAYEEVRHLCSPEEFSSVFHSMHEMLGTADSYTLTPIGAYANWSNGVSFQSIRYLIETEKDSFIAETSVSENVLYGFHLYYNTQIPQSGTFSAILDSNLIQILLLLVSLLEFAVILFALVDAARHKFRHRILWIVVILLGAVSIGFNVGPDSFELRWFLGNAGHYSAWIRYGVGYHTFRLMLPAGALIYFLNRRKLLAPADPLPSPQEESPAEKNPNE